MKKRMLSLALCLVLVVGLFSGLTVNASAGRLDDLKKEIAEKLIKEKIEQLKAAVGVKKSIAEYGISEEDFMATLDQMVEDAFDDQCTGANPRYPLMSEIKEMYLKAYRGDKA